MSIIQNQIFDEERALYGSRDLKVAACRFDGPADGESAFKECRNIEVADCFFNLRYPFWHDAGLRLTGSELTPLCRAALWYTEDAVIEDCPYIIFGHPGGLVAYRENVVKGSVGMINYYYWNDYFTDNKK